MAELTMVARKCRVRTCRRIVASPCGKPTICQYCTLASWRTLREIRRLLRGQVDVPPERLAEMAFDHRRHVLAFTRRFRRN